MAQQSNRLVTCICLLFLINLNIVVITRLKSNWPPLNAIQLAPMVIEADKAKFVMSLHRDDLLDILEVPTEGLFPEIPQIVLHNPLLCGLNSSHLNFVLYVHSSAVNWERRQVLRNTYANPKLFKKVRFQVVFFVGMSTVIGVQERIKEEFDEYRDIVQGNFIESYKNMTIKAVLALKWIDRYCSQADYALKIDDDTFIDLFKMITLMQQNLDSPLVVICPLWSNGSVPVLRDKLTCMKWCVTHRQFPAASFPSYCAGLSYTLSRALVQRLVEAVARTPFFWIDDVYVTGLLMQNVNRTDVRFVSILHLMELVCDRALRQMADTSVPVAKHLFHTNSSEMFIDMWQLLLKRLTMEQKQMIQLSNANHRQKP